MAHDVRTQLHAWLQDRPHEVAGVSVLLAVAVALSVLVVVPQRPAATPIVHVDAGMPHAAGPSALSDVPSDLARSHARVVVHVAGAVAAPGIVELAAGSRVADAVAAAGGVTADADVHHVNLARLLDDGEQLYVPTVGEQPAGAIDATGRIDLNRASADELTQLPGIGPSRAAAIVAHREQHGPFRRPGDLRAVAGIGEATFQQLADRVRVG